MNVSNIPVDGYVNATKLCQAGGKFVADYLRLDSTTEYLDALSFDMGIPISGLAQIRKGGNDKLVQVKKEKPAPI